jgi:hypothetical protein
VSERSALITILNRARIRLPIWSNSSHVATSPLTEHVGVRWGYSFSGRDRHSVEDQCRLLARRVGHAVLPAAAITSHLTAAPAKRSSYQQRKNQPQHAATTVHGWVGFRFAINRSYVPETMGCPRAEQYGLDFQWWRQSGLTAPVPPSRKATMTGRRAELGATKTALHNDSASEYRKRATIWHRASTSLPLTIGA